ncbi:MAG: hypothetical protein ACHQ53_07335 [Polyangiales bacterium]
MKHGRATLPRIAILALGSLLGCQFESAKNTSSGKMNVCSTATDCAPGSNCEQGLCVARNADAPLDLALVVTPQKSPSGGDPLPVVLDRFVIDGPTDRKLSVPGTIMVRGRVRKTTDGVETALDAQLSFTPVTSIPGIGVKAVTVATAGSAMPKQTDYAVELVAGLQYRMLVRATDPSLPPFARTFQAGSEPDLSVDYGMIAADQRAFLVKNAPSDRMLLATALDDTTGEPISSTAMVGADGSFILSFGPDAGSFRLELRAAQSGQTAAAANAASTTGAGPCDESTPAFPVFSSASKNLQQDSSGTQVLVLPPQPTRIRYEGTVALCKEQASGAASVMMLPVALHSRSLMLGSTTMVTASFDATTDASYDAASRQLRFCVQVMEGDYDVVVTPPPMVGCALFAEERLVQAPDGVAASGALLELPSAAYLNGTLQTTDLAPLKGAAVEAAALARSGAIALPMGDHSVTRYNRSQQTTTAADGSFKLPVDLGSYDVVIRPPADSGFPWQVRHDVDIGARGVQFSSVIDMLSPVALKGTLTAMKASGTSAINPGGAQVDAYALIDDQDGSVRGISIGKATADDNGQFMLLLPPSTHLGW